MTNPDLETQPIHSYFELTYASYLIMHRSLLQSMPVEWQRKLVKLVKEYDAAFAHVDKSPGYQVLAGEWVYMNELTEDKLKALGYTRAEDVCNCDESEHYDPEDCEHDRNYYDQNGAGYDPDIDQVFVPGSELIPGYARGRTYVEPRYEQVGSQDLERRRRDLLSEDGR